MTSIAIVGAGSWGTALAQTLAAKGHRPTMWTRDADQAQVMRETGVNAQYLAAVPLFAEVTITDRVADLADIDVMLMAVPTQALGGLLETLPVVAPIMVSCAKGLEVGTGLRPTEIIGNARPGVKTAALSGPSFAREVADGHPTGLSLAAEDLALAQELSVILGHPSFRLYPSDDLIGVELGGALKNVIAIAAGAVIGKDLGENARAALIARGLNEITRLAVAEGGRTETLMGLAGLGDILLTATSLTSRNTRLGHDLARQSQASNALAEGRYTAAAACALAERHGIDMPITQAVKNVLEGERDLDAAIRGLLDRPLPRLEWSPPGIEL
ncbi:MAG: NAD(P)H-dependent glycerol-3-phosphate dehydrogenase [Pseudomonadota bacterium]